MKGGERRRTDREKQCLTCTTRAATASTPMKTDAISGVAPMSPIECRVGSIPRIFVPAGGASASAPDRSTAKSAAPAKSLAEPERLEESSDFCAREMRICCSVSRQESRLALCTPKEKAHSAATTSGLPVLAPCRTGGNRRTF